MGFSYQRSTECFQRAFFVLIFLGLSGMRVEPVTEERAARCLQKIDLISAVREEVSPHLLLLLLPSLIVCRPDPAPPTL